MNEVKDIIKKYRAKDILGDIKSIHGPEDLTVVSGMQKYEFWLSDTRTEIVFYRSETSITYMKVDESDGTVLYEENLVSYKANSNVIEKRKLSPK